MPTGFVVSPTAPLNIAAHKDTTITVTMTTDVFGQTLGDNILGLVYTKNCFYSVEEKQKQEGNETLEDDVEELQRQCHNVEKQNQRLQENIDSMTEQYKALAFEIDSMKH